MKDDSCDPDGSEVTVLLKVVTNHEIGVLVSRLIADSVVPLEALGRRKVMSATLTTVATLDKT